MQSRPVGAEAGLSARAEQVRTPETVPGQPGQWPQEGTKHWVDVRQLKMEARGLRTLTQALPAQTEQIGNGRLPKELIDYLKKFEKLAKHKLLPLNP